MSPALGAGLLLGSGIAFAAALAGGDGDFAAWRAQVRSEARQAGVSERTLTESLDRVVPIDEVLRRDRAQPESVQTFAEYRAVRVSAARVARGRSTLAREQALLHALELRYGVQPALLVALYGLESNYGDHLGQFPIVAATATLAWDPRRPAFFRTELLAALRLIDRGGLEPRDTGSWAGAIGPVQLLPSRALRHGVDFDGDGRTDVRTSLPDALATTAAFLKSEGWRTDQRWGFPAVQPPGAGAVAGTSAALAAWRARGLRFDSGGAPDEAVAALVVPAGAPDESFLAFDNFGTLMAWNHSTSYALTVGLLWDALERPAPGEGPLEPR